MYFNNSLSLRDLRLLSLIDNHSQIQVYELWEDGPSLATHFKHSTYEKMKEVLGGPASGLATNTGAVPEGVEQIDVGGRFVMPGMTESHAHLSFTDAGPFNLGMPTAEQARV